MKTITLIIITALALSGCAGTHNYMTDDGALIETTPEMAYMMSVRDIEKVRASSFADNVALSDRPEQVVALMAGLLAAPGQRIERPRHWDERALPWVAALTPLVSPFIHGYVGGNGGSENVSVRGTGNSVFVTSRNALDQSYIAPLTYSDSTYQDFLADDYGRITPGTGDTFITNPEPTVEPTEEPVFVAPF